MLSKTVNRVLCLLNAQITLELLYIKNLKLTYAASMIRSDDYTLDTIASICGYSDASSLSHAIKNEYGKYPGQLSKITMQR